jgi:hypothetical protein
MTKLWMVGFSALTLFSEEYTFPWRYGSREHYVVHSNKSVECCLVDLVEVIYKIIEIENQIEISFVISFADIFFRT